MGRPRPKGRFQGSGLGWINQGLLIEGAWSIDLVGKKAEIVTEINKEQKIEME